MNWPEFECDAYEKRECYEAEPEIFAIYKTVVGPNAKSTERSSICSAELSKSASRIGDQLTASRGR